MVWLLDRGLRTLDLRVHRHNENAMAVAAFLSDQENVSEVFYPGLPSHPDHRLAKRIMSGFGGMVSFILEGGPRAATRFMKRLEMIAVAPSLGGVETLVSQPRYTSHASLSKKDRAELGIPDGFVRLSVGLESIDDLLRDLEQALHGL